MKKLKLDVVIPSLRCNVRKLDFMLEKLKVPKGKLWSRIRDSSVDRQRLGESGRVGGFEAKVFVFSYCESKETTFVA